MDVKDLKKELEKLAEAIGPKQVCLALLNEGLSPRQCERLSLGDHEGAFRRKTVTAVKAVLRKQGRKLKASA
jgi:hypothetical protein